MAKKILPPAELTRLHYLTDEEADMISNYRLMPAQSQQATRYLVKTHAEGCIESTAGNVFSIARPAN